MKANESESMGLHPRSIVWILILLVAIGFLARLYRIDVQSLSHDEIGRIGLGWMETGSLFRFIVDDGHAPAHPLVLRGWMRLFPTEMTARYLSLVLGCLFIPAVYYLAYRLTDRKVALLAASLAALSPFHIGFSQQGSPYTMVMLLSVLAAISFVEILSSDRWFGWTGYSVCVTLGLYTHLFMAVLPVFMTLFLLLRWKRYGRLLKGWWVCHVLIGIAYIPWILVILKALGKSTGFQKAVGPISILYTFFTYSVGFTVGPSVAELQRAPFAEMIVPYIPIVAVAAAVFGAVSVAGILALRNRKEVLLLLLLYVATPVVFVFGTSSVSNVAYNVRYVCASFPAYLILMAVGLVRIRASAGIVLGTAVFLLFSLSLRNHYFDDRYFTYDMRSTAAYMEQEATQDDVIFVVSTVMPFLYYHDGNTPVEGLDYLDQKSEATRIAKLRQATEGRDRIWLVLARPWYCDPKGTVKGTLDQHHPLLAAKTFPGVEILCYQLN
jgi:mannosyltransferase